MYSTGNSAQCYAGAWMGGSFGENGYMYMYGLVPLLCTFNYHNIVNRQYKIKFKILKIKRSEHKHIGIINLVM